MRTQQEDSDSICQRRFRLLGFIAEGQAGRLAVASLAQRSADPVLASDSPSVASSSSMADCERSKDAKQEMSPEQVAVDLARGVESKASLNPRIHPMNLSNNNDKHEEKHIPKVSSSPPPLPVVSRQSQDDAIVDSLLGSVSRERSATLLKSYGRDLVLPLEIDEARKLDNASEGHFALKIVDCGASGSARAAELESEVAVMREIARDPFPFLVDFYFATTSESRVYIAMELCQGGDLFSLIRQEQVLRPKDILFFAVEMALALQHLHDRRILHGDLKPENVALSASGHIRLVDFGLSVLFDAREHLDAETGRLETVSHSGTLAYCAPEVLARFPHSFESDWWSYGVVLYEMLFGTLPFSGADDEATCALICTSSLEPPSKALGGVEPRCYGLISELLTKSPRRRIGYADGLDGIRRHAMFASVNWDHARNLRYRPPFCLAETSGV
ncbi:Protein kinase, putative [Hondaea fermentalgiana]|uniref:Protein kinase, putative n=1 Tax=Hondaea fermentalgiana TaxID=2315210 RepID=A0A2R5G3F3_9STRA|nr:Protein kinase, putative [Hondaea fermentalgiana]|eukprot:GBG25567.1 Protein kinase, putative [Hondaea fermentalgiana]